MNTRNSRHSVLDKDHTGIENDDEEEESCFKWIGTGVKVDRVMHFGKCEFNEMIVSVGDNVEIKLERSTAVAEIFQLYETVGDDPYRATIRWYYPLKDVPKKFKLLEENHNEKELFKPADGLFLGSEEDIDVETIVDTVTVWEIGVNDTPPPGDYFVRYCFPTIKKGSKGDQKLIPILGDTKVGDGSKIHVREYNLKDTEIAEDENAAIKHDEGRTKSSGVVEKNVVMNKGDTDLKGKLKKNAQKWKSYSTDEVLAELWKTDKETASSGTSNKISLKRKIDNKTDVFSLDKTTTEKNSKEFVQNGNKSKHKENPKGCKVHNLTDMEEVDIEDEHTKDETNGDDDSESNMELSINKDMSPFKSIPKKKESNVVSVFDFDEAGASIPLEINRLAKKDNKKGIPKKKSTTSKGKREKDKPTIVGKKVKSKSTSGISERKTPRAVVRSMLQLARKRLHVSTVPEILPCRDDQFSQIFAFVQDRLKEGTGGCMYISGVPGTGKTATVREVLRVLRENIEESVIPDFKFIEINGMKLTKPEHVYTEILKVLEGKKATPDHASDLLSQRFRNGNNDNVVLLVDELDLLCTQKQHVMYNIFDWPSHKRSRLVVLAVANTMDLPERMMMNRVSSRLGLTRMTFQPYTFKELEEIVVSRIKGTNAFEDDALQLVARKVAAVSGDARRCLDICRRAVEISEKCVLDAIGENSMKVSMKHVDLALREMFSSPKIIALQCLSDMEILFMKAVISEFRRTGLEEAIFLEVYDQFKKICSLEDGFESPNMSEAFTICNNLGSCHLLLVEAGNKDVHQRVRLNVNIDDAMFAFKSKGS